ncbi:hypothetical protein MXD63_25875 [Frankia sp. Cpl3]|uniref:hypothetical protein n=1 Tax=Parafrankia colletiae TaxID=573497 RepID=UPI0012FF6415|nr:hypothetical protein [Parafrankia colletiae]MCK9903469.1 hypothetical protein [Frankia sp. Cpl3]
MSLDGSASDGSGPAGAGLVGSGTFRLRPLPRAGQPAKILLTSDYQAMVNTPVNLQMR